MYLRQKSVRKSFSQKKYVSIQKLSRLSGNFQTIQKLSRPSGNFPDHPETFQTIQKLSRLSRNFPDNPETFQTVRKLPGAISRVMRKNFSDTQKFSRWQCHDGFCASGSLLDVFCITCMFSFTCHLNYMYSVIHVCSLTGLIYYMPSLYSVCMFSFTCVLYNMLSEIHVCPVFHVFCNTCMFCITHFCDTCIL